MLTINCKKKESKIRQRNQSRLIVCLSLKQTIKAITVYVRKYFNSASVKSRIWSVVNFCLFYPSFYSFSVTVRKIQIFFSAIIYWFHLYWRSFCSFVFVEFLTFISIVICNQINYKLHLILINIYFTFNSQEILKFDN